MGMYTWENIYIERENLVLSAILSIHWWSWNVPPKIRADYCIQNYLVVIKTLTVISDKPFVNSDFLILVEIQIRKSIVKTDLVPMFPVHQY